MSVLLWIAAPVIALVAFIWIFKQITAAKIEEKNGAVYLKYQTLPSPLDFYLRVIFSWNNLTKGSFLPKNAKLPPFEVTCTDGRVSSTRISKYLSVCGFDRTTTEIPLPFTFGTILPLFSNVLTHRLYPIKSMAAIIHMRQTIRQLRPLKLNETFGIRGIFKNGRNTERGTEIDAVVEIYSDGKNFADDPLSLIAQGTSSFLILKRRGVKNEGKEEDLGPVTHSSTFKIPEPTGRRYAAASGADKRLQPVAFGIQSFFFLNLKWSTTAKMFGFRKGITQGFFSLSKCFAEMENRVPKYPLSMDVEWKKPVFMPSSATVSEHLSEDRNRMIFELHSEDGQHHHLRGVLQHDPLMQLKKEPLQ